jgi:biopolymer transport protein ExbD
VSAPFEIERPQRREPQINLSALIDVIFILMIFVILGASFERLRAMGIDFPEGDAQAAAPPNTITIVVPLDGPIRIDGRDIPGARVTDELKGLRRAADALVIEADKGLPLQRAIDVLDAARAAGFDAVSIATRPRPD